MAKYNNINYIELPRMIFCEEYNSMPDYAFRLYIYLKELEHKLCNEQNNDTFYRSDKDIAIALNWSLSKVKRAKAELRNYPKLLDITVDIKTTNCGNVYAESITYYKIY